MGAAPTGGGEKIYYGSAAQVITFGPVDILHEIFNGSESIWAGPIMRSDAMDGDGKTTLTTAIGTIVFYWGTATQSADPLLASLVVNQGAGPVVASMPAFLNICYAVLSDCTFGSQTVPPTLTFTLSRFPGLFALAGRVTRLRVTAPGSGYVTPPAVSFTGGGGTGAAATAVLTAGAVSGFIVTNTGTGYTSAPVVTVAGAANAQAYIFNELDGDCLLPEFLFEALTNTFWGLGIPAENLNLASFVEATEQLIAEDIGASPMFDDTLTFRELAGKLLPYMDAFLFFKAGQVHIKLIRREALGGVRTLTEADFTDEPIPINQGFEDTANFFRLTFQDRDNNGEDGVEGYDNPANADIVGQSVDSQVEFPYVTRRAVAKKLVKRVGLKESKPAFSYEVKLQPIHNDLHPGDVVKLSYSKLGFVDRPCRVIEIERARPEEPEVSATLMVEHTRDTDFDYLPPADDFLTPGTVNTDGSGDFAPVSVSPRLQALPVDLLGGHLDGWLTAFDQGDVLNRKAKVWWTWDEVQKEYVQIAEATQFLHHAEIVSWHPVSPDNWILRLRFDSELLRNAFNVAAVEAPEWLFVTGRRTIPSGVHEIVGLWGMKVESGYFAAVDATLHDIEVTSAAFGSAPFLLETLAVPGNSPTVHIYFGVRAAFPIFTTDIIYFERNGPNPPVNPWAGGTSPDVNLERLVKVTVANHRHEQALADVVAVEFDRDDATMNPAGTYTPDWGARAPTLAELFDDVGGAFVSDPLAAGYADADDVDEALGAIYAGTASADQSMLFDPVDDLLGIYSESGVYSLTP